MKETDTAESTTSARIIWGVLLLLGIGMDVLLNLQLHKILDVSSWVWVGLFGAAGLALLALPVVDRLNLGALVPAVIVLALAALIGLQEGLGLETGFSNQLEIWASWGVPIFLAGAGIGACLLHVLKRADWWALPLGGALLTLAVESGVSHYSAMAATLIYFLGLALTVGLALMARSSTLPYSSGRGRPITR